MLYRMYIRIAERGKCDISVQQVLPSERSELLFLHERFSVELG